MSDEAHEALMTKLIMGNLDMAADMLVLEFRRLDRLVAFASKQEYPPVHLLNRINIRLRGVLERSEHALSEIQTQTLRAAE